MTHPHSPSTSNWQVELATAFHTAAGLLGFLGIPESTLPRHQSRFPLLVTRFFAGLMKPGDLGDPLLRQVLPIPEEDQPANGFCEDAVGDLDAGDGSGLVRKYQGRTLVVSTGACAIHCRFCFRRHYPYGSAAGPSPEAITAEARRADVEEIILSGGDPLTQDNPHLESWVEAVRRVPGTRLRIHTRIPTVLPSRIDDGLCRIFSRIPGIVVVAHCNHPAELSPESATAFQQLRDAGCLLLNQSVLLRGVNDSASVLAELSHTLVSQGVLPYYLHQLDRVQGAHPWEVDESQARLILKELLGLVPGYMVPRWVREEKGKASKTPIF